jgi:3-hydroxybutyryl-CoA dehydratase
MSTTPRSTASGDAGTLSRLLDLLWGPDNPAVEGWHEAIEAWSQAWARSVLPVWPWVVPAEALAPAPPREEVLPPFRVHPPGKTIEQLSVGDSASVTRRISQADIDAFARLSGDDNPAHVDAAWAEASRLGGRVAHGMLTAGLISAVLGTQLPGPGSIYMSQSLRWTAPVRPGDRLTATVTITEIVPDKGRVVLETVVTRDGETVLTGEALVMPPGGRRTPPTPARPAATPPPPPAPTPATRPAAKRATRPAAKRATRAAAKPATRPAAKKRPPAPPEAETS